MIKCIFVTKLKRYEPFLLFEMLLSQNKFTLHFDPYKIITQVDELKKKKLPYKQM